MGCSSCASGGGTPRGCKNNGTCSSGGCNKLGVFDWLANMQLPAGQTSYDILEIRFKNSRKSFYRNAKNLSLQVGDAVVVEASPGYDVGVVSIVGELARIQVKKKAPNLKPMETRKIIRVAGKEDIDKWSQARSPETEVMFASRTIAIKNGLEMKISDVEYQGDLTKATFYYTAEGRVDFRQLIKDMADQFRIRIEMRQIGSRQEAQRLGGIGSCGRELCCSTWLTDFRSVSTSAARYQQLSLNPQKLAGQCGKLKCCLNYELDMYLESIKSFPTSDTKLHTEKGTAYHIKTDVFKRQMWFAYDPTVGGGLIALSPERVRDIAKMNGSGQKPADLRDFEERKPAPVVETGYTNLDGQDSLNRFDDKFKSKKRKKKKKSGDPEASDRPQGQSGQSAAPKPAPNPGRQSNQRNQPRKPQQPKADQQQQKPQQAAQPKPQQQPDAQNSNAGAEGENKKRRNNRRRPPRNKTNTNENGPN